MGFASPFKKHRASMEGMDSSITSQLQQKEAVTSKPAAVETHQTSAGDKVEFAQNQPAAAPSTTSAAPAMDEDEEL